VQATDRSDGSRALDVAGVVLAAGLSRRMGAHKPLLPFGGEPMVARVVDAVRTAGAACVAVVTGHRADAVAVALAGRDVLLVHNPHYRDGEMLSSVQAGVRAVAQSCGAALLALGDQPAIGPATIASLIAAWRGTSAAIVSPVYDGRGGHPVLISSRLFDELLRLDSSESLKTLMRRHVEDTLKLEVDDPGVLTDVDTPADYERALHVWRQRQPNGQQDLDAVEA
jgi:molybdenum cofactor cytidylyltransferase